MLFCLVKKFKKKMVIKDKIFDVIIRNNIESVYVSECIVKWLLYKN